MKTLREGIQQEPVRFVSAIQATLAVVVLFGVDLTPEQLAGIVLAIAAWLGFVTRQQVSPVAVEVEHEAGQSTIWWVVVVVLLLAILGVVTGHLHL